MTVRRQSVKVILQHRREHSRSGQSSNALHVIAEFSPIEKTRIEREQLWKEIIYKRDKFDLASITTPGEAIKKLFQTVFLSPCILVADLEDGCTINTHVIDEIMEAEQQIRISCEGLATVTGARLEFKTL